MFTKNDVLKCMLLAVIGFIGLTASVCMCTLDVLGREAFIERVHARWVDLPWWVGATCTLVFFVFSVGLYIYVSTRPDAGFNHKSPWWKPTKKLGSQPAGGRAGNAPSVARHPPKKKAGKEKRVGKGTVRCPLCGQSGILSRRGLKYHCMAKHPEWEDFELIWKAADPSAGTPVSSTNGGAPLDLITPKAAALLWGCTPPNIYAKIKSGLLTSYTPLGMRYQHVSRSALVALKQNSVQSGRWKVKQVNNETQS